MTIQPSIGNATALQQGTELRANDPLKSAAEEFEGMFLSYLLKVMRSTVDSEDKGELSMGKDIYSDLFDNEIALNIARTRSLGIGEMIYRQLQEKGQVSKPEVSSQAIDSKPLNNHQISDKVRGPGQR